jgi:thioesterase domain-containing protein/acyl carrier protein
MVPALFITLDALPLTPNAKIDRKALPAPQATNRASSSREYEAPRNDLEISMVAAWEKVLGVQRVGITDNFFELGGHSLSMMRLAFEMKQATGIEISLGDIFSFPTITSLVTQLGAEGRGSASVVVPLQPEGDEPPIFCICGINVYKEFAQSVDKSQPVFGVYVEEEQAIINEIAKGGKPTILIEGLVDAYFNALSRVRPHGPYRLAGLSFGGILAMELASRLRAHGEQVDLVILFDTLLPLGLRRNWFKWVYYNSVDIMTGRAGATLRRQYNRFWDRFVKQPLKHSQNVHEMYVGEVFAAKQGAQLFSASMNWKGQGLIVDFPVLLFHASDHSGSGKHMEFDEDNGWRHYVGDRLSIVKVAGDHLGIMNLPIVSEVGRETRQLLGISTK